jgi:uncharacterized protein (DUF433 family)
MVIPTLLRETPIYDALREPAAHPGEPTPSEDGLSTSGRWRRVQAEVFGGRAMTTTASWISKKPDRCGGDACIRDTRITVWGLVEWRRRGRSDTDILRSLPNLTADDLAAAREYAAAHPDEIERALWENEACMVEHDVSAGGSLAGQCLRISRPP